MTLKLKHPKSEQTIEVRDEKAAEPYLSQGWVEVKPKKKSGN